jgi:hypothetical protein
MGDGILVAELQRRERASMRDQCAAIIDYEANSHWKTVIEALNDDRPHPLCGSIDSTIQLIRGLK